MSIEANEEWHDDAPPALARAPRRWPVILAVVIGLSLAGAGGFYAWMNLDRFMQSSAPDSAEDAAAPGDKAMLTDLLATQQKTEEDLASVTQALADQREQLKLVTDQLAAMTAKIEALQTAAAPPPPPALSVQPNARAEVAPKLPKTTARPKRTSGPISVGGAPLNATAGANAH
jgi:uncharacterized coiled-coil protein SlyX